MTLFRKKRFRIRALALLLLAVFSFGPSTFAFKLESIDGETTQLLSRLNDPYSLILVVSEESELLEAQRLLSLAESQQLHTLVLIELPSDNAFKANAIESAAKRFFKSDFSHQRVYFVNSDALPKGQSKALLFNRVDANPVWRSATYPDDKEIEDGLTQ